MLANYAFGDGVVHARRILMLGVPGVLIVLAWLLAYATGLFPWVGSKSWTESWSPTPAVLVATGSSHGSSLGTRRFVFLKGQTVVVEYELTRLDRGLLDVHIVQVGRLGGGRLERVRKPSRGRVEYVVPATGIYAINVRGAADKRGYDLSYSARWGAYFPGFAPARPRFDLSARAGR